RSYNVKRERRTGGRYTTIGSPASAGFTDMGVTNDVTYYYVVSAVNTGGESGDSSQASAKPEPPAPSVPTGLGATAGNAQVVLAWIGRAARRGHKMRRGRTT